jgi:uncharacterized membrane protein YbhN (UPF0104 family)
MSFGDAFIANVFGDAACALTPLRIGGEPARLAGMLRAAVPATASFVAISIEIIAAWPIIILSAAWLAWAFAPEWWSIAEPGLRETFAEAWPWVVLIAVVSVVAWWLARRAIRMIGHRVRRPLKRVLVYWRRMPRWPIAASLPCTLVNVVARTAILPILALTLPVPPDLGPTALGAFALLYSQLILPTPSGVGAVDLGFLAGAAGDLGDGGATLLLLWRFYTSGFGIVLGLWFAARVYGWRVVRGWIRSDLA